MQVVQLSRCTAKLRQKASSSLNRSPQRSPRWHSGVALEFEHVMLGPEKRRAMLE